MSATGATLAVGGAALGIYSRFFARPVPWDKYVEYEDVRSTANSLGLLAVFAGLLVVSVVVVAYVLNPNGFRDQHRRRAVGVCVSVLVVVVSSVWLGDVEDKYVHVRAAYMYTERFPTTLAACLLVIVGAALVAVSMAAFDAPLTRKDGGKACGVGVAVTLVLCAAAIHLGDDSVNIDHTLASPAEIPPIPSSVGNYAYTLAVPADAHSEDEIHPRANVVAAGAGFVVATKFGVTAYDAKTGTERWHYLRRDPAEHGGPDVSIAGSYGITAYDGGRVLVAHWDQFVAFDALTGEVLWTKAPAEFRVWSRSEGSPAEPALIATAGNSVVRVDPWTGRQLWSRENPDGRCGLSKTALFCSTNGDEWPIIIEAIDLETGAVTATREIPRQSNKRSEPDFIARSVGGSALIGWKDVVGQYDRRHWILLTDSPSLTSAPVQAGREVLAVDPTGAWAVTADDQSLEIADRKMISASTFEPRYDLPERGSRSGFPVALAFLADQLVEIDQDQPDGRWGGGYRLQTWNRASGAPETTFDIPIQSAQRCTPAGVPVQGAFIAYCRDERSGTANLVVFR